MNDGSHGPAWQDEMLADLRARLEPDAAVIALLVFGSMATQERRDQFSDIDAVLVVDDTAVARYFPATGWLTAVGAVFAIEQQERAYGGVHRVCFEDMRRLDAVVINEGRFESRSQWEVDPFRRRIRCIFSRSTAVDAALRDEPGAQLPAPSRDFAAMCNAFWFGAQAAIQRTVRGDLLIARHLSLSLEADCLVLALMLRDRAAGGAYLPHGAESDTGILLQLDRRERVATASGVLDTIVTACRLFDELASRWERGQPPRLPLLQRYIEEVRRALPHSPNGN